MTWDFDSRLESCGTHVIDVLFFKGRLGEKTYLTFSLILRFNLRLVGSSIWSTILWHEDITAMMQPRCTQKITRSTQQMTQYIRSIRWSMQGYVQPAWADCPTGLTGRYRVSLLIRPGAAVLLTGVKYSRIRDSIWNVPYSIVTTRTGVELVE